MHAPRLHTGYPKCALPLIRSTSPPTHVQVVSNVQSHVLQPHSQPASQLRSPTTDHETRAPVNAKPVITHSNAPQFSQITMRMVVLAACGRMHQAACLRQNRLQPRAPNSSQPDLGTVVALRANALAAHRDGRAGPLRARGLEGCRVPPRLARSWALRPVPRGKVRPGAPQVILGLARQTLACWEPVCPAAPRIPWGPAPQQRAPARTGMFR